MQRHDLWMEGAAGVTARGAGLNVKQIPSKTKTSNFTRRPCQTPNFQKILRCEDGKEPCPF